MPSRADKSTYQNRLCVHASAQAREWGAAAGPWSIAGMDTLSDVSDADAASGGDADVAPAGMLRRPSAAEAPSTHADDADGQPGSPEGRPVKIVFVAGAELVAGCSN